MRSSIHPPRQALRRPHAPLLLALALTLLLSGCASPAVKADVGTSGLRAHTLDPPIVKPAVTLTDTSGHSYDVRARTAGRLTLLFFGYTHCPDECPATMATIAVAEKQLVAVRSKITVLFVTTDPARDTPAVLKKWLAHFPGGQFVGLTGSEKAILHAASLAGVPLDPPEKQPDGTYAVAHGAQVLAFSPADNKAHAVYTLEATSDDYAHDLPLLVGPGTP